MLIAVFTILAGVPLAPTHIMATLLIAHNYTTLAPDHQSLMLIFIIILFSIILALCVLHPQLTTSASCHMGCHMSQHLICPLCALLGPATTLRSTVIFTLVLNYTYFLVQIVRVTRPSAHVMSFDNCLNPCNTVSISHNTPHGIYHSTIH